MEEIIEMARQAGFRYTGNFSVDKGESLSCFQAELEAFAKLVEERTAAKEREACTAHAITAAEKAIDVAMKLEREACAKVCEPTSDRVYTPNSIGVMQSCAAAIRARGEA